LGLDASGNVNTTLPILAVGTHSVRADFQGNTAFAASSGLYTQTIVQNQLTINISVDQTLFTYGSGPNVTVSISGGAHHGTLRLFADSTELENQSGFSSNSSFFPPVAVPGGSHQLTVRFDPDDNNSLQSFSNAIPITINPAPSTVSLTSNSNPIQQGFSLTFNAQVRAANTIQGAIPSGTVDFSEGGTDYGTVPMNSVFAFATLNLSNLSPGSHIITASYSGDANYQPSTTTYQQVINLPTSPTSTTVSSPSTSYVYNQDIPLNVTVTSNNGTPTGQVAIIEGSNTPATATLSNGVGVATINHGLPVGNHILNANYGGDSGFSTSSSSINISVSQATPTLQVTGAQQATVNQSTSYSAVLTAPFGGAIGGTVSVNDGTASYGPFTVSGGTASCPISFTTVGSKVLTFQYSGDGNFNAVTQALSVNVTPPATTTLVAANPATVHYHETVTFTAAVKCSAAVPTGSVQFLDTDGAVLGTAPLLSNGTDGVAQFMNATLTAGSHTITVNYQPDGAFATSSVTMSLTILPASVSYSITNLNQTYDGSAKAVTVGSFPTSTFQVTYNGSTTIPTDAGTYAVSVTSTDPNFTGTGTATLTVAKATQTISFPAVSSHHFGDADFTLGATSSSGLPVTYTLSAPATVSGSTVSVPASGGQTQTITVTASQTGDANHAAADSVSVTFQLLENVAPVSTIASTPTPSAAGWNKGDVTVTLGATDNAGGDGVKELHYSINNGTDTVVSGSSTSIVVSTEGSNTITYFAVDNAGNSETSRTLSVKVDKTAPTLAANPDRAPDANGWYTHAVQITYSGDDGSGSGIDPATLTAPQQYSGPDSKTAQAVGSVSDLAGNSASAQFTFKYDATAPIIAISGATPGFHKSLSFSASASDSGSGSTLKLHVVLLKNGVSVYDNTTSDVLPTDPGQALGGSSQDGSYELDVTCTDEAGWSSTKSVVFVIDNQVPDIEFVANTPADNSFNNSTQTISYTVTAQATIATLIQQVTSLIVGSDIGPVSITSGFQVANEGQHSVHIAATDVAGNSAFKDRTFYIDLTPPTVSPAVLTGSAATNASWFSSAVTVGISASDPNLRTSPSSPSTIAGSGVKEIRYFTSGAQAQGSQSNPVVVPGNSAQISITAQGVTTVTYWAVDNAGNVSIPQTATAKFDSTPPQIVQPANITVVATGVSGAVATYGPFSASDNVDTTPTVVVTPVSGTNFPIGITAVTVIATDDAGNASTLTFNVTVTNPVPVTTGITPGAVQVNAAAFTLTVNGSNFMPTSVVNLAGHALTTHFVSSTQLTASVPTSAVSASGNLSVTVTTAAPGGGTSNAQSLKVGLKAQTITFGAVPNHKFGDAPFTLNATASSGLSVTFTVLSGPATVSGNTLTLTGAGTVVVQASQAGNNSFDVAPTVNQNVTVTKATPTVKVTGGSYGYDGQAHAATVVVTGVGGAVLTPPALTYSPGGTAPVNGGTYTASANFAGDANYTTATGSATVTITPAAQHITFGAIPGHTFGDAPFAVSASASSNLAVTFSIVSGPATVSAGVITITGAGSVTVRASQAGNANYSAATSVTHSFTVAKATPTVSSTGGSFSYDGTHHAATFSVTGVGGANLGSATVVYSSGSGPINVGTYTATGTYSGNANYTSASATATIVVNPATLTVKADNKTKALNANNPPLTGSITGLVAGDRISATYTTTATTNSDIGVYPINASMVDPLGRLSNYVVSIVPGTLSVMYASNTGIQPPINPDGSSVWFVRLPLPVSFKVFDANNNMVTSAGTVTDISLVSVDGSPSSGTPASFNNTGWFVQSGNWIFLIDTSNLSSGHTYAYRVTLKDGSVVPFQFTTR
jgi:hypothetical protein